MVPDLFCSPHELSVSQYVSCFTVKGPVLSPGQFSDALSTFPSNNPLCFRDAVNLRVLECVYWQRGSDLWCTGDS